MSETNMPNPDERALTAEELDAAVGGMGIIHIENILCCPKCGNMNLLESLYNDTIQCGECGHKWAK